MQFNTEEEKQLYKSKSLKQNILKDTSYFDENKISL